MDDVASDGVGGAATGQLPPAAHRTTLDTVVQRLFALGLTVQSVATSLRGDERGTRLSDAVANIDITIREVRTLMEQTTTGGPTDDTAPRGDARP